MSIDPFQYYCFKLLELHEGGSDITEPHAGITSDMKGRWTIGAFDTKKSNKKETPEMKESIYSNNAGIMEVFRFFEKATDEQKSKFDELINAGEQDEALKLMEKVLNISFEGSLVNR